MNKTEKDFQSDMRRHPEDYLQPNDPAFKKKYGWDSETEGKLMEKRKREDDGNRKAYLEEKHWRQEKAYSNPKKYGRPDEMPLHSWERKALRREVLED